MNRKPVFPGEQIREPVRPVDRLDRPRRSAGAAVHRPVRVAAARSARSER
ncbi:hypothetical protein [Plantactinospora mayteni]|nr:hypothetical protein [Plantactinospora mayteni]